LRELRDAEADTLQRLSEDSCLDRGRSQRCSRPDAIRAALTRTFDRFVVRREAQRVHVEFIVQPKLVIEPVVRAQAVEGYSENMRPILRLGQHRRERLSDTYRKRAISSRGEPRERARAGASDSPSDQPRPQRRVGVLERLR
jgi:hypothetical protein